MSTDPPPFFIESEKGQRITLALHLGDLRKEIPKLVGDFDLIFHDPFSPARVPDLWTVDLFQLYHQRLMKRQGRLCTYSAAGAVRGGLQEAGFHLYRTKALGQKNGGTLASTYPLSLENQLSNIYPLTQAEAIFIASRSGIPYRDPNFDRTRLEIQHQRILEQQASQRPPGDRSTFSS